MKLNIELSKRRRERAAVILNGLLADEFILGTKTRNTHWNVTGPNLHDLHKLFASQSGSLHKIMDDVAHRARALGGHKAGTLSTLFEFFELARLKEQSWKYPSASQMTAQLITGHEAVIRQLRGDVVVCNEKLGDAGTADFLGGLMKQHEKMARMLRTVLEEKDQAQTNGTIRPLTKERK
ncbi:MAG TPA: DNA starvation/stationary phase protection protein [Verrucomicrobiae bacterium]|nr:DNA starvation/stationary phase protection protein [Verrucomicrobiae bacterium]